MTDWVQVQGTSGWQQWADIPQADEMVAVAADWTSPQSMAGVANDPTAQRLLVQGALASIGSAFQSLNLPPLAWPAYRVLYNQYFGNVQDVNVNDAAAGRQRSQFLGAGGTMAQRLTPALQSTDQAAAVAQCAINSGVTLVLDHLDENGNVFIERNYLPQYGVNSLETLWTWDVITNQRDPLASGSNLVQSGQPSSLDWGTIAWQSGPSTALAIGQPAVPSGQSAPCGVDVILYPYVWQVDFINDVIAAWQSVGAAQVLDDARNFVTALNAYNAALLGLLPADLQAQALAIGPQLQAWLSNPDSPPRAAIRNEGLAVFSSLATIAPPYGAIVGGIIALASIIISVGAPIAVGYLVDPFGRMLPNPSKPTTSAWQAAQLFVNPDGSPPTIQQLPIPSPQDLAPAGITVPNPYAPATQAPAPLGGGGALLTGKILNARNPVGRFNPLLQPTRNIGSQTAGIVPQVDTTQPFTGGVSTVPVQGTATTPVAASTQTATGAYIGADGKVIATPQTAPASTAPAAQVAPTSSALSAAINNPLVVSGGAAALTGIGILINRIANR